MKENKKVITTRNGSKITVDTSDEAIAAICEKAGINPPLKSGQRVTGCMGEGLVEGVGDTTSCDCRDCRQISNGTLVLWFSFNIEAEHPRTSILWNKETCNHCKLRRRITAAAETLRVSAAFLFYLCCVKRAAAEPERVILFLYACIRRRVERIYHRLRLSREERNRRR